MKNSINPNTHQQHQNMMQQQNAHHQQQLRDQQFADAQRAQMTQQQTQMRQQQLDWRQQQQKMGAIPPQLFNNYSYDQSSWQQPMEMSKSVGRCRYCGYAPVGKNAIFCPNCMASYPNPSRLVTFVKRVLFTVVIGGFLVFGLLVLAVIIGVIG